MTVATSLMIRNNPSKKTLLNVTISMMTTMTTVLHRDSENDWSSSPFPLYKLLVFSVFYGLDGVAASSLPRLHDRALVFVEVWGFHARD